MSIVILDFGSGNTCKNDKSYIDKMYDELVKIDKEKHTIVVKWQLFEKVGNNIPLQPDIFDYAYHKGEECGYDVTASVFDVNSLKFLLQYKILFVKLANNRELDYLINYIPSSIFAFVSSDKKIDLYDRQYKHLWCISNYPANISDYEKLNLTFGCNISDHTSNFTLFRKYNPGIVEWHYKLDDSNGLDAGEFARTPKQLDEIL
jgi:sialic acid synthase SpsE